MTLTTRRRTWFQQRTGHIAEGLACLYLMGRGLRPVAWRAAWRAHDVDLVMLDGSTLVFVEVRLRRQDTHGSAAASVTPAKQRRCRLAAAGFLAQRPRWRDRTCRFDVCTLERLSFRGLVWLPQAFFVEESDGSARSCSLDFS